MTQTQPKNLFSYRKFWAQRFGTAEQLPMTRAEMDALGWDSCDIILVTGDAYIDHPSFGMAVVGRLLEAQGFRVGILAQPDWNNPSSITELGKPNLFFGVTAGNMDSLVNHYTSDRKIRSDDAYTPDGAAGKRPDRAVIVYSQLIRRVFDNATIVIGGIEASLRRIAHYDYWSDEIRRSVLVDSQADILLYGNAERAIVELAHRLAANESVEQITDIRGTAYLIDQIPADWSVINSTRIDKPGMIEQIASPYQEATSACQDEADAEPEIKIDFKLKPSQLDRENTVIKIPSFEQVSGSKPLYAHTSRVFHLETNPGNARALVQKHGRRYVWLNPPPIPLETEELDQVFNW